MREELATVQRDLEASRVIRSELALELANATTDRKLAEERLEVERFRAEELIKQIEEKETAIATLTAELDRVKADLEAETLKLEDKINNYRIDLLNKDEEIREKEKTICELENLIVSAAKNDDVGDTPSNPTSPQNTQDLKTLIKTWKRQSKSTRDWTKANQLISELENLL